MPKDKIDTEDPLELVGCVVDGDASDTTNMARCFVEEFYMMGWTGERILEMFQNPFYRNPHSAYRAFGEDWVKALIDDVACTLQKRQEERDRC